MLAEQEHSFFTVEQVVKRFYNLFKQQRTAFLSLIQPTATCLQPMDCEQYGSLLLNRLMFLYFLQKKGFLAGNVDYLRQHLSILQASRGINNFYEHFLLPLFHQGLNHEEQAPELANLLGDIPDLACSLFSARPDEQPPLSFKIPDRAFEQLFAFFDRYQWYLDEQALRHTDQITPAILGHIFEQYVNQQQMGAYYTREDVTDYIANNTIIPSLFEAVAARAPEAFQPGAAIWQPAQTEPDRYIVATIRSESYLPGETLQEYTLRRAHYHELRRKLVRGDIYQIDDFITYNLHIQQFAADTLSSLEDPLLLQIFYEQLQQLSVLDPTCGSGAFLLAALRTLLPLYAICLTRLAARDQQRPEADLTSQHYNSIKAIITRNLYGIDIMQEALEICRLRLFLKLLSSVQRREEIETLPDLDTQLHVGNMLLEEPFEATGKGFAVIIGNPPYVEYNQKSFPYTLPAFTTLPCANIYTCVVEHSVRWLTPQGRHGMILPLAAFSTRNMIPFIEGFQQWFPGSWLSFYHFRPSMLFSGGKIASIPTTIYLARTQGPTQRFSTHLNKWFQEQRHLLFERLTYCPITVLPDSANRHYYPKFSQPLENTIMAKLRPHTRISSYLASADNGNTMFYRSAGGLYWKLFINFPWPYDTTSNKQCAFQPDYDRDIFVALFNSSLFWWYYTVTFDTFNLKNYMLFGFRFSYPHDEATRQTLKTSCRHLMDDFYHHAQHRKRGETDSYTIYAKKSKSIIDTIDHALGQLYGFTSEELDFILNYDIKYRMGQEKYTIPL